MVPSYPFGVWDDSVLQVVKAGSKNFICRDSDIIPATDCRKIISDFQEPKKGPRKFNPAGCPKG